jgi:hypothetical protein
MSWPHLSGWAAKFSIPTGRWTALSFCRLLLLPVTETRPARPSFRRRFFGLAMHPYPWPSRSVRAPAAEMPHFGHIRFFKRKGGIKSAHLKPPRLALWCSPISGFLDRMARSPASKGIIHDAYSHGCDGSTLFDWIGRRGSITLSSPLRWCSSSLRGSARGVVRLVHALSGRQ